MNQPERPEKTLSKVVEDYVFSVASRYVDSAKPPLQSKVMDLVMLIDKPHTNEKSCSDSENHSPPN